MLGAIIDMDGTILESMGLWEQVDIGFLRDKRGIEVPADYMNAISPLGYRETALYTIARFNLPDSPEALMAEWEEMAVHEYENTLPLKPYAREFLTKLKKSGTKTALCTSSPECFYAPALKRLGVYSMFDAFVSASVLGLRKGEPEIFLTAAESLGLRPEDCTVFDDMPDAIAGAKAAGMKACGVYDRYSASHMDRMKRMCDRYVMSLEELI